MHQSIHTLNCFVCRALHVNSQPVAAFITLVLRLIRTGWWKIKLLWWKRRSSWGRKKTHFIPNKNVFFFPFWVQTLFFSSLIKQAQTPVFHARNDKPVPKCDENTNSSAWLKNVVWNVFFCNTYDDECEQPSQKQLFSCFMYIKRHYEKEFYINTFII